jgi:hypothetical protein
MIRISAIVIVFVAAGVCNLMAAASQQLPDTIRSYYNAANFISMNSTVEERIMVEDGLLKKRLSGHDSDRLKKIADKAELIESFEHSSDKGIFINSRGRTLSLIHGVYTAEKIVPIQNGFLVTVRIQELPHETMIFPAAGTFSGNGAAHRVAGSDTKNVGHIIQVHRWYHDISGWHIDQAGIVQGLY